MVAHDSSSQVTQVNMKLQELLARILKRGFYGSGAVEISVQDGVPQEISSRYDERTRLERVRQAKSIDN